MKMGKKNQNMYEGKQTINIEFDSKNILNTE
jgi:hypothetical protein